MGGAVSSLSRAAGNVVVLSSNPLLWWVLDRAQAPGGQLWNWLPSPVKSSGWNEAIITEDKPGPARMDVSEEALEFLTPISQILPHSISWLIAEFLWTHLFTVPHASFCDVTRCFGSGPCHPFLHTHLLGPCTSVRSCAGGLGYRENRQ